MTNLIAKYWVSYDPIEKISDRGYRCRVELICFDGRKKWSIGGGMESYSMNGLNSLFQKTLIDNVNVPDAAKVLLTDTWKMLVYNFSLDTKFMIPYLNAAEVQNT